MKPRTVLTMVLFLSGGSPFFGGQAADDEKQIRDLVDRYVDARERIDEAATAALFTDDSDQLVSSGEWRRGKQQVVEGSMKSSKASTGKRSITIETLRFVSPDIALVDGHYDLAGGARAGARHMWTALLLKRTATGWKITAIRNMLPAPRAN